MEMREYIEAIAESCRKLIISKPATKQEEYRKIIVQKKEAFFQMEKYTDKQVFHENLSVEELEAALEELMQKKAKVALDEGYIFGEEGRGFERINVASPRSVIEECMNRIRTAFEEEKLV